MMMMMTSRDLLKIEYLIGYDCVVGLLPEDSGFALRARMINEGTGEDLFFQRMYDTKQLSVSNIDKHTLLVHFADEAKHNFEYYLNNNQKINN